MKHFITLRFLTLLHVHGERRGMFVDYFLLLCFCHMTLCTAIYCMIVVILLSRSCLKVYP